MRVRERMRGFMTGRYGADQLSRVYLGITMACLVISLFTKWQIFYMIGIVLLVYTYFRIFSKNISKRYEENQKFLNWRYQLAVKRNRRKIYRYFKCPGCKQKVRIPKGKGKVAITCPKCHMEFIRKS